MPIDPISHLAELRSKGIPCALITIVGTTGSTPRKSGAKMVVNPASQYPVGTIGGGKLEALALEKALLLLSGGGSSPNLHTYSLNEAGEHAFGAICGGEVIILTEPFPAASPLVIVGAGHCGAAIARIADQSGFPVTLIDDRPDLLQPFADSPINTASSLADLHCLSPAPTFAPNLYPIGFVAVSRNYEIDIGALRQIISISDHIPYLGMIGSRRKVRRVFDTLAAEGVSQKSLDRIFAPVGLDIGAESPVEIAISVVAQILAATRGRPGGHFTRS